MFHSRQINHKINKLHEKALRIDYNDHFSSFEELLSKERNHISSKKSANYLLLRCMWIIPKHYMQDIFETKSKYYNARNAPAFSSGNIKTDMD